MSVEVQDSNRVLGVIPAGLIAGTVATLVSPTTGFLGGVVFGAGAAVVRPITQLVSVLGIATCLGAFSDAPEFVPHVVYLASSVAFVATLLFAGVVSGWAVANLLGVELTFKSALWVGAAMLPIELIFREICY